MRYTTRPGARSSSRRLPVAELLPHVLQALMRIVVEY